LKAIRGNLETFFRIVHFQREILSHGKRVQILVPESFKNLMKEEIEMMMENFS